MYCYLCGMHYVFCSISVLDSTKLAKIFDILLFCVKDMNEPASFVDGTVGGKCLGPPIFDHPPYMPCKTKSAFLYYKKGYKKIKS